MTVEKKNNRISNFYSHLFSDGFFIFDHREPYFQEKVLQIIWNEQILTHPFFSEEGKNIEIIHHGIWNVESGPDFHDAVISIDGKIKKGAVEIHLRPEDWTKHKHQYNQEYENVILHVVWQNPKKYTEYPDQIPIFCLSKFLSIPIQKILLRSDLAFYPYGKMVHSMENISWFSKLGNECLSNLFQSYGISRILEKSQIMTQKIEKYGFEETTYQVFFEAMGYKNNKNAFAALASYIPLKELSSYSEETALSVLFGAAGLLPDPSQSKLVEEYVPWVNKMWSKWWPKRKDFRQLRWKNSNTRPYNSPERRLLAAHIVLLKNKYRLGQNLVNAILKCPEGNRCLADISQLFTIQTTESKFRFVSFSKKLDRPVALLGKNRINDLVVNLVIPLFFAYCMYENNPQQCQKGKVFLLSLPRLQDNRKFKEAAQLFFLPPSRSKEVIRNACAQQGMLNLYQVSIDSRKEISR